MDRHNLRRTDTRDMVLVHRSIYRSARSVGEGARRCGSGTIFAGFLKILPVFILVLPGLIAAALWPEIRGDMAYPNLVTGLLPVGLKGLVMAGLLAALMSSLAACFNSTSTLFTMDLYKPFRKHASERELVFVGRLVTALLVAIGLLWIPFIKYLSSQIYIYLQSVQAYISPPIAVCFLLGLFWKRANGNGAIAALFSGFVLGAVASVLNWPSRREAR